MRKITTMLGGVAALALATSAASPAIAQEAEVAAGTSAENFNEGDIIVTARRRVETAQETPVAISVLNEALLDRYAVKGIASIQTLTPGLVTGEASGSVGGSIALRGIGSGDSQPFIDQAISLNVDGVPISTAQLLRAAQLDLQQIEILRGPQALFFGKNSPGGIISLISSDPGDELEAMARIGYEFETRERYAEGMVSTPLTDTVGVRVAGRLSKMDGYMKVISPPPPTPTGPGLQPSTLRRFPDQEEMFLRGTIAFRPTDGFRIRLKGTYTDTDINGGPSYFSDITACPYGVPQGLIDLPSNCRNDGVILTSAFSPAFLALDPFMGTNPNGFRSNKQGLFTGTADLDLTDALTLTSVTGYYRIRERLASNGGYGLSSTNGFNVRFNLDQITQEIRLRSDFDGPVNFLVGGFYEFRELYTRTFIGNPNLLTRLAVESTTQKQESYSGFGQILWEPTEQFQVTVGGRYTTEIKRLMDFTVTPVGGVPIDATKLPTYPGGPIPKLKFNNFSPEATVSYKPTEDVMVFASYKRGFKSGGFDAGFTGGAILAPARQAAGQTFRPEKVQGGEVGLKSQWLDRRLTINLTGYWYTYKDLQVSFFDTTVQTFLTLNAARARIRGLELETRYRPEFAPGLSLNLSAAYNDAKFLEYFGPCFNGQSPALGCNQRPNAAGTAFTSQDLSGRQLRKAPKFSANFGAYYEFPVTAGLMMSLSSDVAYSGGYDAGTSYQPLAYQEKFAKVDATMRLFTEDKRWELAAIGRNLTDKRNIIAGIDRTGTGGVRGSLPTCTTLAQTGCARLSDIIGTPTIGRTIAIQGTFRY